MHPGTLWTIEEKEHEDISTTIQAKGISKTRTWGLGNGWRTHTQKILLACGLIVAPMFAFTIALVWIVFANLLNQRPCPFPDLCPGPELLNTTGDFYYYVDFPATRLAFLASLSSSISFSLVSIVMSIYAYSIAKELLDSSMGPNQGQSLPSPYQMSVLIRLLNAEILTFWELGCAKFSEIFWRRERSQDGERVQRSPRMVKASIGIFVFSLLASIYIQAADTYLHISTDAVNMVEVQVESATGNQFSRGLAPECINRQTTGTLDNKNFWSCSLHHENVEGLGEVTSAANSTSIAAIDGEVSTEHDIYSFDHSDGDTYAVVAPANMDPNIDWKATTFGASTQCSPIPADACEIFNATMEGSTFYVPFNCTKNSSGIDFAANITQAITQHAYLDFHKYLKEEEPFKGKSFSGWKAIKDRVPNITESETDEIFRNPWHWMHVLKYADDVPHTSEEYMKDPNIWRIGGMQDLMLLSCNTTIWDVEYTVVGGKITSLSKTKSNGSLAGISSMATTQAPNFMAAEFSKAYNTANSIQTSPSNFISSWKTATSRTLALPLAAQSSARPSTLVQRRSSKVVTRLPKAALWVLVSANMSFAILGLALSGTALRKTGNEVYQVYTRLGVSGLSAALFEKGYKERIVREDSKLFEENLGKAEGGGVVTKKVGVGLTRAGGAGFTISRVGG